MRKVIFTLLISSGLTTARAALSDPTLNVRITPGTVAQADAIVEGSFSFDHILSNSKDVYTTPSGAKIAVNSFLVPFSVEKSSKGNPEKVIAVKLAFPADANSAVNWGLPVKEKLLLFLIKDNRDNNAYQLYDPKSSWLIVDDSIISHSPTADSNKFVLEAAKGFLKSFSTKSSAGIQYLTGKQEDGFIGFKEGDPSILHALTIGRAFANGDPEFIAIAQKYINQPGRVGEMAREIIAASGDYGDLLTRLKAYQTGKLSDTFEQFNFPTEVAATVKTGDMDKIMPLISQSLASPNSRMRLVVVSALRQRKTWGHQLYPVLINLLKDPDSQVQYQAMGCIFAMSGSIHQRPGARDVDLPTYANFQKNPNTYLTQYNEWWKKNQGSLK